MDRRVFLTRTGKALLAASTLARARTARAGSDVVDGQDVFERLVRQATELGWSARAIGERMGLVGLALLHTPYVDGTLERYEDREVCSVDFRGLDCVTFYENALAFARMLRRDGRTPAALLSEVTFTRYRGGRLTDYASRLHYTVDWFA